MLWILFEALLALALFAGFVYWVMAPTKKRDKPEPPQHPEDNAAAPPPKDAAAPNPKKIPPIVEEREKNR